jgi:hypothetical protein
VAVATPKKSPFFVSILCPLEVELGFIDSSAVAACIPTTTLRIFALLLLFASELSSALPSYPIRSVFRPLRIRGGFHMETDQFLVKQMVPALPSRSGNAWARARKAVMRSKTMVEKRWDEEMEKN